MVTSRGFLILDEQIFCFVRFNVAEKGLKHR